MYKSFRVKNFRCFKDLQINDLGRVNLIAGKNNTGKTALLEAMYLHTRPKSPDVLFDIQDIRGLVEPEDQRRDYWRQFFYNIDETRPIKIEATEMGAESSVTLIISELSADGEAGHVSEIYRRFLAEEFRISDVESHKIMEDNPAVLEFSVAEASHQYSPGYLPSNSKLPTSAFRQLEQSSEFIPVQGRQKKTTTLKRLSKLDQEGDTPQLVDVLTTLDERISDVRLSMPDGIMDIWARVNGALLPLKAMGEGVNRICHILVTMLSDVDYLFIDEIENGIHHSVQCKVWQAIGQMARELDIQIFATTHSYEMIRAAYKAFSEDNNLDEFRYHRLSRSRKTGELRATTYSELDLEAVAAFDFDHEVR